MIPQARRRAPDYSVPMPLGPWVRGMVNTVSDHALPIDALVDARDVDIGREGFAVSRPGYELLSDADTFKYLFEHLSVHYAVSQGHVGILGQDAFTTIYPVEGAVGWSVLGGQPVFCDYNGVYRIEGTVVTQLVVRPTIEEEDRYSLVDMPGGKAVSYWQGRLLVLRGRSLLWSEPLDYGCHSPARNFVRFSSTPTWMAPLPSGIFVGLQNSVVFLPGTNPAEFQLRTVAGRSSPGASLVIDDRHLAQELQGGGLVALWFSDVGFVVGRGDGGVVYPQAGNLKDVPIVPRTLCLIDDRIYAFATEE